MANYRGEKDGSGVLDRVYMDQTTQEAGIEMRAQHDHNYFELYLVIRGFCRYTIQDSTYDLHDGDFILIPPHTFHSTRYPTGSCRRSIVFFNRSDIGSYILDQCSDQPDYFSFAHAFHLREESRGKVHSLYTRMAAEEKSPDEHTPALQELYLQELLILLLRGSDILNGSTKEVQTADRQILLAARYINSNYMNPITASDIAAAAGFSPNYLSRKFRQEVGIGVHEYLVTTRLQHAAGELLSTTDSITDIALRCGFSDSNYFKDAFKKKYGMTPRDYRNSDKSL